MTVDTSTSDSLQSHLIKKRFLRYFAMTLFVCFVLFLICGAFVASRVRITSEELEALKNYKPPQMTIFYDSEGNVVGHVAKEKRVFVRIDSIPTNLKNAFIATEDRTFYTNHGIDFFGIVRAAVQNVAIGYNIVFKKSNERFLGASTITQQVVRNLLLTNERTLARKAREIILSVKIASLLSKNEVFEIYLNHIYLGNRSYGVASAAKMYFNKNLEELTIAECATLASLPKSPSLLNLKKGTSRALDRRNWVLKRMLTEMFITKVEYNQAIGEQIYVSETNNDDVIAWGFLGYVQSKMGDIGITQDDIKTNGYRVHTTMKTRWQNFAQESLDDGLLEYTRRHDYKGVIGHFKYITNWKEDLKGMQKPARLGKLKMAVVLSFSSVPNASEIEQTKVAQNKVTIGVENGTFGEITMSNMAWALKKHENGKPSDVLKIGDVIVVSQVVDDKIDSYRLEQIPEIDGGMVVLSPITGEIYAMVGGYADVPATFNRAFQAERQIGSTVKPIVYLAGLENGLKLNDIFIDSELLFNIGQGEIWSPRNVNRDYAGPMTMRTGLERSVNTVTIRVAQAAGLGKVIGTCKRLKMLSNYPTNLTIALGSAETTLLNLARVFAIIANEGIDIAPKAIQNISYGDGSLIGISSLKPESYRGKSFDSGWSVFKKKKQSDIIVTEGEKTNGDSGHQVVSSQSAYQLISALKGATKVGSVTKRTKGLEELIFAGKTGTSQDGRDLWFVGVTPEVVVAVYVGFDTPRDTGNEFGSTGALPIFVKFMNKIKDELSNKDFPVPKGLKFINIDKLTGIPTNRPTDGVSVITEVFKESDNVSFVERDKITNHDSDVRLIERESADDLLGNTY